MIIKDIQLTNFGKFCGKELKFNKGLNIIYGENEAGKTTIHTFLRGMLFGIEKQRGRSTAKDTYSKYEPWENPSFYEGVMHIEADGITYRIERNFNKENKSCVVVREDLGVELAEEEIDELFSGFNENCYYNTISISQLGGATDKELETILQNYAANLGSTKSTELDIKKAVNSLKEKRKEISSENKLDQKRDIQQRIAQVEDELEMSLKEQDVILEKIKESKKLLQNMENERRKYDEEESLHREEIAKRKIKLEDYQNKIDILNRQLEEREGFRLSKRVELGDLKKKLREMGYASSLEVTEDYNRTLSKPRINKLLAVATIIVAAIAVFYYLALNEKIVAYCAGAAALVGTVALLIILIVRSAKRKKQLKKIKEAQQIGTSIDILQEQLDENKEESNFNRSEIHEYSKLIETENVDILNDVTIKKELEELNEKIAVLSTTIAKAEWQIEQKQTEDAKDQKNLEELRAQIESMATAIQDVEAIDTAIETIEEIATKVRESFGKNLNEYASKYISKITNGKYDNLVIDEKLNITINSKDKLIKLDKLSKGTIEQIYMALRLSAADILFKEDKKPILMDDVFAMYDNKRMANTMKFMATDLEQVILFSCHTREKVMADKLELPYTLIKL